MALTSREGAKIGRGLVIRALLAAATIIAYLSLQDTLGPRALVTARFGVGVALFALLVDVGRTLLGTGEAVEGDLGPHRQVAEPLVDERYERVHEPVERYVNEGVWTTSYERILEEAFEARDLPAQERERVLARARRAASTDRIAGPPTALTLAAGAVAVVGTSLSVGVLLEALEAPMLGPVLLFVGAGLALLQIRARDLGARWTGLGLGIAGTTVAALGAVRLMRVAASASVAFFGLVGVLGIGSIALAALGAREVPPWPTVEAELEDRFTTLRRAFLVVLLAGGVLFPFKPLLEELFAVLGWPLDVPYRIVSIGYATLATYLAVEMAATWHRLSRGRRRARDRRRRRVEANQAILEALGSGRPTRTAGGEGQA